MTNWQTVCRVTDLTPNIGVCALIEDQQVAIFNCARTESLYAVANFDPIGKATCSPEELSALSRVNPMWLPSL